MVRLMSNISNPDESWTTETRACEWSVVDCDENERMYIAVGSTGLYDNAHDDVDKYSGTFAWIHIPDITQSFVVRDQPRITGTLPMSDLPSLLHFFQIIRCNLFGPIDLTVLPPSLTYVNLRGNQFSGTLEFTSLPKNLSRLILSRNGWE